MENTQEKQTNLAEGELDTVEESIRAHERKGDLTPDDKAKQKPQKDKESA